MARRIVFVLVLSLLLLPFVRSAHAAPTAQASCSNTLYKPTGQNFWVATPTSSNQNGAVVVFVHGYTSDHNTWTGSNYAVRDACTNGFRVAAVDLNGTGSIWANGSDLAAKLQAIASYYGVGSVNIMAHSKGGLDSQTAIVHYGAYARVQTYIAFGSPFGGTDLADHACSWYGFWLWQCNDATRDMRISNMTYVRSITDGRVENDSVLAYAARGSKCDWYNPACALISGSDDGVVPTWSAWANAEDTHIADRTDLRHGEVHQTQRYNTAWLFGYLGRDTQGTDAPAEADAPLFASSHYTLRGGQLAGRVAERVTVEGGLDGVTFSLLSTADARVAVVSPSGQRYATRARASEAGDILQGTFYEARVAKPEAGVWLVVAEPTGNTARAGYLLRATFEGGLSVQLDANLRALYQPGSDLALSVTASQPVAEATVAATLRGGQANATLATAQGALSGQSLRLPAANGLYNLDLRITGRAADGTPFERTLATSLAVVDPATVTDPASVR